MKDFLIITSDGYPEGDAGALRKHAFAKLIKQIGYNPIVIGMGTPTDFEYKEYDEIKYISLRYSMTNLFLRALGRILFFRNLKKKLVEFDVENIKGILIVSCGEKVLKYVEDYAVSNKIPIFHDSVEWYSASEFKDGEKDRRYIASNKLNTEIISKNYKVISISKFLDQHFKSRGIESIRVPVILDVINTSKTKSTQNNKIKIVYAGQAGKKDYFNEIIEAIDGLPEIYKGLLNFVVIGMTKDQFKRNGGIINDRLCPEIIKFLGRKPRKEVLQHLETADFTIFLRPHNERYAKAGFPTKFVESLSSATPVITNLTSDLSMYLEDGINGFVIKNESPEEVQKTLIKALSTSYDQRIKMEKMARKTAEKYFDYRLYEDMLSKYIN